MYVYMCGKACQSVLWVKVDVEDRRQPHLSPSSHNPCICKTGSFTSLELPSNLKWLAKEFQKFCLPLPSFGVTNIIQSIIFCVFVNLSSENCIQVIVLSAF